MYITKQQMQKLDDLMTSKYGVKTLQMMELAGYGTAELCRRILQEVKNKRIVVIAGTGNNGGDGIAAARFLHNWGAKVSIFVCSQEIKENSQQHLDTCKKIGVKILKMNELEEYLRKAELVIDAIFGYNINGDPTGIPSEAIKLINNSRKEVLSIDLPSGLDPNSGEAYKPCVNANYTLSLSLPKYGVKSEKAGKVHVLDLGVPNEVLKEIGVDEEEIFSNESIIELEQE